MTTIIEVTPRHLRFQNVVDLTEFLMTFEYPITLDQYRVIYMAIQYTNRYLFSTCKLCGECKKCNSGYCYPAIDEISRDRTYTDRLLSNTSILNLDTYMFVKSILDGKNKPVDEPTEEPVDDSYSTFIEASPIHLRYKDVNSLISYVDGLINSTTKLTRDEFANIYMAVRYTCVYLEVKCGLCMTCDMCIERNVNETCWRKSSQIVFDKLWLDYLSDYARPIDEYLHSIVSQLKC